MNALGSFLATQRKRQSLSVAKLASAAGLSAPITHKYVTGERVMPRDRAAMIRSLLCHSPDDQIQFDELYERSLRTRKRSSAVESAADERSETIRVGTIRYPPFAGTDESFVDRFVSNALKMSQLSVRTVRQQMNPSGTGLHFDVSGRIGAVVDQKDVDLMYGLASLDRSRQLVFVELPIRVAVAGAIFISNGESEQQIGLKLAAAKDLLIHGKQPANQKPWQVLAVEGEIAHVFLTQTHGLQTRSSENAPGESSNAPSDKRCLHLLDTLEPDALANSLRRLSSAGPAILSCDENTILLVVEALSKEAGGFGCLVLPPNNDQAAIHSERRLTPAYHLAIGMRRNNNWEMVEQMRNRFSVFLNVEGERIAEWYEVLYTSLVKQIKACLATTGVYVGGIRRTFYRLNEQSSSKIDSTEWAAMLETILDQHARTIARRSLSLSRRALESLPADLMPWKPILLRARERIQTSEGGDRGRIRNLILYCARIALGRKILQDPDSPDDLLERPLTLLRSLNQPYQPSSTSTSRGFNSLKKKQAEEYWDIFVYLMELELDLDLRDLSNCDERFFTDSSNLGDLVSRIQLLLEASRDAQLALTVRPYNPKVDAGSLIRLVDEYVGRAESSQERESRRARVESESKGRIRLMAWHLGEAVGFLDACQLDPREDHVIYDRRLLDGAPMNQRQTIRVDDLHVTSHMHHVGVSRRLIRRIVETGNREHISEIWIQLNQWPDPKDHRKFQRSGFRLNPTGDRLWYSFILND